MPKPYPISEGLKAFFYNLAFSHKKEYAAAAEEAKKPETRMRRIQQMTEMILALRAGKKK